MSSESPPKGRSVRNELEQLAAEYGSFIVIIVGVVVVKWAWSETKRSWRDWIRHISVALFVGAIVNSYLADIPQESLGDGAKGAILALIVLQADHLFVGFMRLGSAFRENPSGTFRAIIDTWRGRK